MLPSFTVIIFCSIIICELLKFVTFFPNHTSIPLSGIGMIQLEGLYLDYKDRIEGFIKRMVRDTALAQDLTQETFIRAQKGLKDFRGESSPLTWLFRIANNLCLDQLRKEKGRGLMIDFFEYLDDRDHGAEEPGKNEEGDEQVHLLEQREMSECVQEFVDRLPETYQSVMVLYYLEGFSIEEISGILGASSVSIRVRLHRAREELKALLEEGCDFCRDERDVFVCTRKEKEEG
jgi:RNA polymerase sigma-70 factor (ECF subfamily)